MVSLYLYMLVIELYHAFQLLPTTCTYYIKMQQNLLLYIIEFLVNSVYFIENHFHLYYDFI